MSLRISRVQGQEALDLLPELGVNLVFPNDEPSHEKFLKQVAGMLINSPEQIQVIVAVRDNQVIGFLIANNAPECVYIAQCWSKPGNNFRVFDEMFLRVLCWCYGLGKTSVRADTVRDLDAAYERAGFTLRSHTIERQITPEMIQNFTNRARDAFMTKEEVANG